MIELRVHSSHPDHSSVHIFTSTHAHAPHTTPHTHRHTTSTHMLEEFPAFASSMLRVRRQADFAQEHGFPKKQRFTFTEFGLKSVPLLARADQIVAPVIGYLSPVKSTDQGLWPQQLSLANLFTDNNLDAEILEMHRSRETKTWVAHMEIIEETHKIDCEKFMCMVDWLSRTCEQLRFHRESFHGCVAMMIRYLTLKRATLGTGHLQLIAVVCLWIMAKLEEDSDKAEPIQKTDRAYFCAEQFLNLCETRYTQDEIKIVERDVLHTLSGNLSLRNAYSWFNLYMSLAQHLFKEQFERWSKFRAVYQCYQALDAAVHHIELACVRPSRLAAGVLAVFWPLDSKEIETLSSYSKETLLVYTTGIQNLCGPQIERLSSRLLELKGKEEMYLVLPEVIDQQMYDPLMAKEMWQNRVRIGKEAEKMDCK